MIEDIYQLPGAQLGLLLEALRWSGSTAYIEQLTLEIDGAADERAWRAAWQSIFDRAPGLRTSFHLTNGKGVQVVHRKVALPMAAAQLPGTAREELRREWKTICKNERARGFDLGQAPLARVCWARVSPSEFWSVFTWHHVILDGWSLSMVVREVLEQYCHGNGCGGGARKFSALREHLKRLRQKDTPAGPTYWQDLMRDLPPQPLVTPRYPDRLRDFGRVRLLVPEDGLVRVERWRKQQGLSLHSVLMGAWALVLMRETNAEEVAFGTTLSGREEELVESPCGSCESAIGMFINTIPVRAKYRRGDSIPEFLHRLQAQTLVSSEFQWSASTVDPGGSARPGVPAEIRSLLVVENYPVHGVLGRSWGAIRLKAVDFDGGETQFPISIIAVPGTQLGLTAVYREGYFTEAEVLELVSALRDIIGEFAAGSAMAWPESRPCVDQHVTGAPVRSLAEPRTPTEQTLARIFQDLLKGTQIGIFDDFFEWGGQSLLAVQLLISIRDLFGVEIPLADLFGGASTIAALGERIDAAIVGAKSLSAAADM